MILRREGEVWGLLRQNDKLEIMFWIPRLRCWPKVPNPYIFDIPSFISLRTFLSIRKIERETKGGGAIRQCSIEVALVLLRSHVFMRREFQAELSDGGRQCSSHQAFSTKISAPLLLLVNACLEVQVLQ